LTCKSILSLETKLTRLETANDKLMDAYEEQSNPEASAEIQSTLEQGSEFIDNVIDKVSQLEVLKEEVEKKRRELDANHTQNLEQRLTQVQEQMLLLQSSQTRSVQPPLPGAVKPAQTDIPTYSGDVLKWNEFWDMFKASVHKDKRYADIDKFMYLKSKLSGDALEAIAGYQLSNDNYKIVVDVLKKRFGNKQVVIDSYYHNLSHLPMATNQASSLHQCYDTIERNLRSLETIKEDVNQRHFIAKASTKSALPAYMLKAEDKERTVSKLHHLLGKHISAMEMANLEFSERHPLNQSIISA